MALVTPMKYNTAMTIASSLKLKIAMIGLLIAALAAAGYWLMQNNADLGNGYEFMPNRGDNLHIRKAGQIAIDSTIVSLDTADGYIVGLRLPADHLDCNGANKIRLSNIPHYFVVATKTDEIWQSDDYNTFQSRLANLNLAEKVMLDYSLLDSTWATYAQYYKKIDFSQCHVIAHQ